eukprot:816236-Prorocentrum_minimum.AAC.9
MTRPMLSVAHGSRNAIVDSFTIQLARREVKRREIRDKTSKTLSNPLKVEGLFRRLSYQNRLGYNKQVIYNAKTGKEISVSLAKDFGGAAGGWPGGEKGVASFVATVSILSCTLPLSHDCCLPLCPYITIHVQAGGLTPFSKSPPRAPVTSTCSRHTHKRTHMNTYEQTHTSCAFRIR